MMTRGTFIGYASHANEKEKESAVSSFDTRKVILGTGEKAGCASTAWLTTLALMPSTSVSDLSCRDASTRASGAPICTRGRFWEKQPATKPHTSFVMDPRTEQSAISKGLLVAIAHLMNETSKVKKWRCSSLSLHRHFWLLVYCRLLKQIVSKRKAETSLLLLLRAP
jgi:hypothetical protein